MGYKIIWSPDALDDIEAIGGYIARDSEFYAESTGHGSRPQRNARGSPAC